MYIGINEKDFPKIRRYFPDCFYSIVEAVSAYLFKTSEFNRIFSFHTFDYAKKGKEISLRKGTCSLDVCFSRDDSVMKKVPNLIKKYYGVSTKRKKFREFKDYEDFVIKSLEQNKPVITDFNMGHVEGLWTYKKFYDPHAIVLIGIDKSEQKLYGFDQSLGLIKVSYEDFKDCFKYNREHYKVFNIYNLSHTGKEELKIDKINAIKRIKNNLKNLKSTNPNKGFNGLESLKKDLDNFFKTYSKSEGYYLQEIWEFPLDRYIIPIFIRQMTKDVQIEIPDQLNKDMDQLFSDLFSKWNAVVMLIDKNIVKYKMSNNTKLLELLGQIYTLEQKTLNIWEELYRMVSEKAK